MSFKANADSADNSFVVLEPWETEFVANTQMCKPMTSTFLCVASVLICLSEQRKRHNAPCTHNVP